MKSNFREEFALKKSLAVLIVFIFLFSIVPLAAAEELGTTVQASIVADITSEYTLYYDWDVERSVKPVSPDYLEIGRGEQATAVCTATVTKIPVHSEIIQGVRGEVAVTNSGTVPTRDLSIAGMIQANIHGYFEDAIPLLIYTGDDPILDPGETGTYPYDFLFTPSLDVPYRVVSYVTITNYEGNVGPPSGPTVRANFMFPSSPMMFSVDSTATLNEDSFDPLDGFETASDFTAKVFEESGSYTYNVEYKNVSAESNQYINAGGTLSLVEIDSGDISYGYAVTPIFTGNGPADPIVSVSHDSDYWKNHCKNRRSRDLVSQYLPIWLGDPGGRCSTEVRTAKQAASILSGNGHNDLSELKKELLAAKLNIASGVDGSPVELTLILADDFLATNRLSWARLPFNNKRVIHGWIIRLESFNDGD